MVCLAQKPNTLTAAEKKEGWQLLFDGKTTKGWHTYNKPTAEEGWKVADGALYVDTATKTGRGDLTSDKEYTNFDLKIDWKIAPKGNSGIIFYVKEDPKYHESYLTGLEMQVLDNDGHNDGKITKHRAGDLYDLVKSSSEPVKPVGQWNTAEIKSKDGKLQLYLNGVLVVSTTLWDDNWWAMVKASKFKAMPDFGKFKTGKIDLQDHGNMVSYRNIKIKTL
ncbi:MAG: DUF1080 domain-containing protein [Bacteroidetes bacterium]|nr:DUF1080 domain-containing protein [Bacteroidota bacterium]